MHINDVDEFEELVHDIKCPLLIFFITKWTKDKIDWDEIEQYRKNINIISIDVDNMPELVARHQLGGTPSIAVYNNGWYRSGYNGCSSLYIKNVIGYFGR